MLAEYQWPNVALRVCNHLNNTISLVWLGGVEWSDRPGIILENIYLLLDAPNQVSMSSGAGTRWYRKGIHLCPPPFDGHEYVGPL